MQILWDPEADRLRGLCQPGVKQRLSVLQLPPSSLHGRLGQLQVSSVALTDCVGGRRRWEGRDTITIILACRYMQHKPFRKNSSANGAGSGSGGRSRNGSGGRSFVWSPLNLPLFITFPLVPTNFLTRHKLAHSFIRTKSKYIENYHLWIKFFVYLLFLRLTSCLPILEQIYKHLFKKNTSQPHLGQQTNFTRRKFITSSQILQSRN